MAKILTVFGTRPEVIKLAPVIQELDTHADSLRTINVATSHRTDLLYLAIHYFRAALRLRRFAKTPLSLLLHPLDFLGCDDLQKLVLLVSQFKVRTMQQHASEITQAQSSTFRAS
jgi:hypothetical protein